MAEVAVKKASEQKQDERSVARGSEGGLARHGFQDPFAWWTPGEFLSNPFAVMRRFNEEMDRTFSRFWNQEQSERLWAPAIEVSENNGQLRVHAELPGLKPEDVRVEVTNDQLVIEGERKYEQQGKEQGVYRSERRYGRFYRSIPLPEGANTEGAKAQFQNGVLEISMPVPEQKSKRREIPIQSK